nr:MAG TPA: hypothetical protein [Crassvirales sp.]
MKYSIIELNTFYFSSSFQGFVSISHSRIFSFIHHSLILFSRNSLFTFISMYYHILPIIRISSSYFIMIRSYFS